jgi:hypothetical protein
MNTDRHVVHFGFISTLPASLHSQYAGHEGGNEIVDTGYTNLQPHPAIKSNDIPRHQHTNFFTPNLPYPKPPNQSPNMTTAVSFHHLAISPLLQGLRSAHHFISKGQAHAQAQGHDENDYLTARLHPEMFDLIYQVQRFTDGAKFLPPRINSSCPSISLPDTEKTFPEILARVQKTIDYLESIKESDFEGKEGEEVVIKRKDSEQRFSAMEYVLRMAHPNFWYVILVMCGDGTFGLISA